MQEGDIAIRIHDSGADALEQAVREAFPGVEVTRKPLKTDRPVRLLVTFRPPTDEDLSVYTWVHSTGAGVDAILEALPDRSSPPLLTRTLGRMGDQIGEYCLAYALAWLQKMALRHAQQTARIWDKAAAEPVHLFESDVAIVGTGGIGCGIARAFKALGATVTGYSRSGRSKVPFDSVGRLPALEEGAGHQIVIAALPLTPETNGLLGTPVFDALSDALFINVGRGATVDEPALQAGLARGTVNHAVLDVFATEPPAEDSWVWDHPNVTLTPHVSGHTRDIDAADRLVSLLRRCLAGEKISPDADPERGY